jgi:Flp pilus assembly protein TadD
MGRADLARTPLRRVGKKYAEHPEVFRLRAGILDLRGDHHGAANVMRRGVGKRPDDALYHNTLGMVRGNGGDFDGAIESFQRACELKPDLAIAWFNLGVMLVRSVRNEEAAAALERTLRLVPAHTEARALLANLLRMQGDTAASAAAYREVLAIRPQTGMAWWGLADLRAEAFGDEDIARMQAFAQDANLHDNDRIAAVFALARARDERGQFDASFAALGYAHALARRHKSWNATAFSDSVARTNETFATLQAGASDAALGHEAVFIVGMPRSGTTLVEQILASHSAVEGTGELPDLTMTLNEESDRRGQPLTEWSGDMQDADWQRLGERYLERTARWRESRPRFTDKMPSNWMYVGAIRAMLPGAHVVICRRDPLETCFSCYRQYLLDNDFAHTPEDLAAYWRGFERSATRWAELAPKHVIEHDYEALQADPEAGIRKLLQACDLPFEDQCLRFYETRRPVRSPSATQVRQALRRDTARAPDYGELLDPLRDALGLAPFAPQPA